MLVAGIDLAAEPKGTALALMEWNNNKAKLQELFLGVDDAQIVEAAKGASKIGIDCAFGWPMEFFEFLTQHMNPNQKPKGIDGAMEWRRTLSYRETDREVRKVMKQTRLRYGSSTRWTPTTFLLGARAGQQRLKTVRCFARHITVQRVTSRLAPYTPPRPPTHP